MTNRETVLATLTDAPLIDEVVTPADVAVQADAPLADPEPAPVDVATPGGDPEEERVVAVDRYAWLVDNGRGGSWHLTACRGDVVRVSADEAARGEALGALIRTTPIEADAPLADPEPAPVDVATPKTKKGKR